MIKKLLLFGCLAATGLNAQNSISIKESGTAKMENPRSSFITAPTTAQKESNINGLQDTLWYTYNKHTYRNTAANANFFSLLSSPQPTGFARLTHLGALFQNTGTLTINGVEAMMSRKASSTNASITVHVLLYNASNGVPVMPALDSISAVITGTSNTFVNGDFNIAKQVTGDYAVMYRCASAGDTIMGWSNNAATFTSSISQERRYGESFGLMRVNGNFRTTTDFISSGDDREYIVAARVQFNSVTSVVNPTTTPCATINHTYTSSVSSWMTHRQYNFNVFHKTWKPFLNPVNPNTNNNISADSVFVWNFGDATGNKYPAAGSNTISYSYSTAAIGSRTGTFTVNYQTQAGYANRRLADRAAFTSTVQQCVFESINEISGFENLSFCPNPTVNGKTTISGLTGTNIIAVYNMLGQQVTSIKTDRDIVAIDLLNQANGNYFVKITNTASNATKVVKVVNYN